MRLIDADIMRENLEWCKSQSGRYDDIYWDDVIERLDVQPTIDAAPVRHGRWQRERNPMRYQVVPYVFVCDQCGTAFEYDTPYCGECGAKMDEVEDG